MIVMGVTDFAIIRLTILILAVVFELRAREIAFPLTEESTNALEYLQKYGYLNENLSLPDIRLTDSYDSITDAIKDFQSFAGVETTGVLNAETLHLMSLPRCGVRDRISPDENVIGAFSLQGSKWHKRRLTYRISKYSDQLSRQQTDREIRKAFKVWSDFTPLTFEEVRSGRVDIEIRFETRSHASYPFDGPGGTLAHAYFPQFGGDAHFDDTERWTIDTSAGINLFQVATHEFGHSLGLEHSEVRQALMAPFYKGYEPDFRLHDDDIDAIQILYGHNDEEVSRPVPDPTPIPPTVPSGDSPSGDSDLCKNPKIDAITQIGEETFIFQGSRFWKLGANKIMNGYPREISSDFEGLPSNLDAAVTFPWSKKTYFFKGKQYWRFSGLKLDHSYPKLISEGFKGIPSDLDGAFLWSDRNILVFFKGRKYWRYDVYGRPHIPEGYPKDVSFWRGVPRDIDAVFQYSNGKTYFFKDRLYWRFNDGQFKVEDSYPKPIGVNWYGC